MIVSSPQQYQNISAGYVKNMLKGTFICFKLKKKQEQNNPIEGNNTQIDCVLNHETTLFLLITWLICEMCDPYIEIQIIVHLTYYKILSLN